jgi:Ni,Fe-hydrogenase III small subunit
MRDLLHNLLHHTPAEPAPDAAPETVQALIARLDAAAQARLGRSLALRHVDTGSCGGCELELRAATGVLYGLARFGLCFVASPRHADVLIVTGPLTRNLREALERSWDATPDPKWVVALGDCAADGGVFKGSYAVLNGAEAGVPLDLVIRGCPPTPAQIIEGLRSLLEAQDPPPRREMRRLR